MRAISADLLGKEPLSSVPFKTAMASNNGKEAREKVRF